MERAGELDRAKLRFGKALFFRHGYKVVPIVYDGAPLLVRTPELVAPDGAVGRRRGGPSHLLLAVPPGGGLGALLDAVDRAVVTAGVDAYIDDLSGCARVGHEYVYAPLVRDGRLKVSLLYGRGGPRFGVRDGARHPAPVSAVVPGGLVAATICLREIVFDRATFYVRAEARDLRVSADDDDLYLPAAPLFLRAPVGTPAAASARNVAACL